MEFRRGLQDGIPIGLGYFAVSIAFGLIAVGSGCTLFEAVLLSFTNLTSAGQFAGVTVMASMGTLIEMALTQFVINARYMLMSISVSQKVDEDFSGIWRWILGFAMTDEIFAVAIQNEGTIKRNYFAGLMCLPMVGWTGGTFTGALLGNILPEILTSALGVALYGMFIAVVIPKASVDHKVLFSVILAVLCSVILRYVPLFSGVSGGFTIIICAVVASGVCAVLFPVKEEV